MATLDVVEIRDWVAEVAPASLDGGVLAANMAAVEETFARYPILVFRDQRLSASELAEFTRRLGDLETPSNAAATHPECRDVLILSNEIRPDGVAVGSINAGEDWHSDQSHLRKPSRATMLYAVQVPSRGGDTLFCNMFKVYENLSPATQAKLENRYGIHHVSRSLNPRIRVDKAESDGYGDNIRRAAERDRRNAARDYIRHALLRVQPETGRKAVYASPRFVIGIEGMDDSDAQPLLDEVFAATNDSCVYRHRWTVGDLVMWDNRWLNHRAGGGYQPGDVRKMFRTVVCGDEAYAGSVVPADAVEAR